MINNDIIDYLRNIKKCEVITCAPAAFFIYGEHAVTNAQPALVMPVPKYRFIGIKRNNEQTELDIENPIFLEKDEKNRIKEVKTGIKVTEDQRKDLYKILQKNFKKHEKEIKNLTISQVLEFPTSCGLNSSGAFAVALTLGIMELFEEINKKDFEDSFKSQRINSLINLNSDFNRLFKCSWEIENTLDHGEIGSGVGVFSSIAGSPDGTPLLYTRLDTIENIADRKILGCRLSELIPDDELEKFQTFLWGKMSFLVFCTGHRQSTDETLKNDESTEFRTGWKNVANLIKHFESENFSDKNILSTKADEIEEKALRHYWETVGSICLYGTSKLLNGMDDKDDKAVEDIVKTIKFNQNFLIPLNLLTTKMEQICSDIYAYTYRENVNIGIKITGAGRGGDLVVVGKNEDVKKVEEHLRKQRICEKGEDCRTCKTKRHLDFIHFDSNNYGIVTTQPAKILHSKILSIDQTELVKNESAEGGYSTDDLKIKEKTKGFGAPKIEQNFKDGT